MVRLRVETQTKKRIALVILLMFLMWPFVHYLLSRAYHLDHWRFSGFAMYARPAYVPQLQISAEVDGRPLSQDKLRAALGADSRLVDELIAARKLWGDRQSPEAVGRLILERLPELNELTITIITVGLEPGADYLSYSSRRYRCTRPQAPGSKACQ